MDREPFTVIQSRQLCEIKLTMYGPRTRHSQCSTECMTQTCGSPKEERRAWPRHSNSSLPPSPVSLPSAGDAILFDAGDGRAFGLHEALQGGGGACSAAG